MASRAGKLVLMEDSERERRELERQSRSMPSKFRHYAENRRRLRERPAQDPEVGEAGIERAREALRVAAASRHQT